MQLKTYLSSNAVSDAAFADLIGGVGEHAVRKWKYRDREPDAATMAKIEVLTGGAVTLRDWAEPRLRPAPSEVAA